NEQQVDEGQVDYVWLEELEDDSSLVFRGDWYQNDYLSVGHGVNLQPFHFLSSKISRSPVPAKKGSAVVRLHRHLQDKAEDKTTKKGGGGSACASTVRLPWARLQKRRSLSSSLQSSGTIMLAPLDNQKEAAKTSSPQDQQLEAMDMDTRNLAGPNAGPAAVTTGPKSSTPAKPLLVMTPVIELPTVFHFEKANTISVRTDSEALAAVLEKIIEVNIEGKKIPVQIFRTCGATYCKRVIYDIHTLQDLQDDVLNLKLESEKVRVVAA
ncbi:hypothetical protein HPB47_011157, partial [Ixodes persulcatus]